MKISTKKIALLAIITALTVAISFFLKIPMPLTKGVVTVLDAGVILAALRYGRVEGAIVGGLSGLLFDLLSGYPHWAIFSLIIHGGQGFVAGAKTARIFWLILSCAIMVIGYFLVSWLFYGFGAAFADMPGNIIQSIFGVVVGLALSRSLEKVK
ncbi:ECF transporter S component [Lactococcus insecticola]|uniref:Membrane protein n=1 Tax=Pseudolactococcus insecticola TaxID=2709158 RepID=A0A6A0B8G8_9LACT|nr:ECF transporter S component [Lactococcus insecticola]GFH40117.1 membrane protein [Lactococcus insecticola]